MSCNLKLLAASCLSLTSLWAQQTVCDLFKDLRVADGRQLILTGELLISKDLAVLGGADCEEEFHTQLDKQTSLLWPAAVYLRPSSALPAAQLNQFKKAAAEADRLRKAGKTLSISATFAGRLRVTAPNDFPPESESQSVLNREGVKEFPAEFTFSSIEHLKIEELPDDSELPVIPICELFQNLTAWKGKRIAVRAEIVSPPAEGGLLTGNCKSSFYTNEYRWPAILDITQPTYYSPSTSAFYEWKYDSALPKGYEQLQGRKNVIRTSTYVGRVRMRSDYRAVCREEGRYLTNGFQNRAPAALILEAVRDVELTPGHPRELHENPSCHPPNQETLCAAAPTLLRAVRLGCLDRTRELLTREGVDGKDTESASLRMAILRGDEAIVKLMLDAGAPVNPARTDTWPPLWDAARAQNISLIEMLLKAGADVDGKDYRGSTYLASYGYFDTRVEKLLLDAGANPNARDDSGATALMHTATFADEESAKILIQYGADVNLKDNSGQTALMYAARGLYVDTIPVLLAAGADVDARDLEGQTALDIANKNQFGAKILPAMIRRGR